MSKNARVSDADQRRKATRAPLGNFPHRGEPREEPPVEEPPVEDEAPDGQGPAEVRANEPSAAQPPLEGSVGDSAILTAREGQDEGD